MSIFFVVFVTLTYSKETNSDKKINIGQFKTHIELFHYQILSHHEGDSLEARATALGGFIQYTSAPLYHFGLNLKQYASHLIFQSQNPENTSLTDWAGEDINPLSEFNLYYQNDNVHIKAGKQQLQTPLINDDTTRLIPFSYLGLTADINLDTSSKLFLGHISEFRANNSETYTEYSSSGFAEKGVSFVGLHTTLDSIKAEAYYYYAFKLYNTLHLQVEDHYQYSEEKTLFYGIQAIHTQKNKNGINISNTKNGGGDVKLVAGKIGIRSEKFSYTASLSYNFGEDGINRGYGGLSSLYTTAMITNGKLDGNPFAKSLKVRYTYKNKIYSSALYLTNVSYKEKSKNSINSIYIDHKFNFRAREYLFLRFEHQWISDEQDKSYFRIISAYDF
ncbi:MAG: OprD family outer membrane porin [Campylobacterota bacterium]|nr:OprD family outer membrane porin [Campylobacterota bacterium]